jgi:hypothetical protein
MHCNGFADQPFVGIPLHAILIDLVLERCRIQHGRFVQKPLMAADMEFQLSLAITPAGDCIGVMHHSTSTLGIVESL